MTIWFTADWHLSHANILAYCRRPFATMEGMDQTLLENYRTRVAKHDTVYFLGDLTLKTKIAEATLLTLPGKIHFIVGNHDTSVNILKKYCVSVSHLKTIEIAGQPIVLCHYAMRVWDLSHCNSWQLYAHSHGRLPPLGKQHDVGVDNNDFCPVSFEQLTEIMAGREDNADYIEPQAI